MAAIPVGDDEAQEGRHDAKGGKLFAKRQEPRGRGPDRWRCLRAPDVFRRRPSEKSAVPNLQHDRAVNAAPASRPAASIQGITTRLAAGGVAVSSSAHRTRTVGVEVRTGMPQRRVDGRPGSSLLFSRKGVVVVPRTSRRRGRLLTPSWTGGRDVRDLLTLRGCQRSVRPRGGAHALQEPASTRLGRAASCPAPSSWTRRTPASVSALSTPSGLRRRAERYANYECLDEVLRCRLRPASRVLRRRLRRPAGELAWCTAFGLTGGRLMRAGTTGPTPVGWAWSTGVPGGAGPGRRGRQGCDPR